MVYSNKTPAFQAGIVSCCIVDLDAHLYFTRQPGSPEAIVTQLAFSPTKNLIAWTDNTGAFSRWLEPIPDTLPSPVKVARTGAATLSVKRKPEDTFLFGDDAAHVTTNDGVGDAGIEDLDDDWIIDDIGKMDDEPEGNDPKSKHIKEMGTSHFCVLDQSSTFWNFVGQ